MILRGMNYTLITGATSGIGRELASIAAREKRNLVLLARNKKALEEIKIELLKSYNKIRVEVLAIDLSQLESAQKVYDFCSQNKLFVDELINNAGFGDYGEFSNSDVARQLSMIDLNIRSITELTHLFLPAMVKKKHGKIMNLGSVASFLPGPLMSVYFASKSYVLRFSEALAEELKNTGVSVTCLCPGPTKTNFGNAAKVSKTHSTANPKTTARDVAEFGWYHLQNGTRVAIHGRGNRLIVQAIKFIPRTVLAKLVQKIQR